MWLLSRSRASLKGSKCGRQRPPPPSPNETPSIGGRRVGIRCAFRERVNKNTRYSDYRGMEQRHPSPGVGPAKRGLQVLRLDNLSRRNTPLQIEHGGLQKLCRSLARFGPLPVARTHRKLLSRRHADSCGHLFIWLGQLRSHFGPRPSRRRYRSCAHHCERPKSSNSNAR